jgi:hypothetical protein
MSIPIKIQIVIKYFNCPVPLDQDNLLQSVTGNLNLLWLKNA